MEIRRNIGKAEFPIYIIACLKYYTSNSSKSYNYFGESDWMPIRSYEIFYCDDLITGDMRSSWRNSADEVFQRPVHRVSAALPS